MKALTKGVSTLGLAGCLAAALPATAQVPLSDYLRVFDPTGTLFEEVNVTEANENPQTIYLINDPSLVNQAIAGLASATKVWEDQIGGTVSDVFGIAQEVDGCGDGPLSNDACLFFTSGGEAVPPLFGSFPLQREVVEINIGNVHVGPIGGGSDVPGFDATIYLNPELVRVGWTAVFWSDPDQQTVPEPGSLALLGIGAAALGAFSRRKNTQA